jgi:hypothetical protein
MEAVPDISPAIMVAVGNAVKAAYAQAFKTVYLTSIAFGGLAIIAALFITSIDDLMTDFVARKIQGVDAKLVGSVQSSMDEKESTTAVVDKETKPDSLENAEMAIKTGS